MYCQKCGTQNPDGAPFCRNCGNKMSFSGQNINNQMGNQRMPPVNQRPPAPPFNQGNFYNNGQNSASSGKTVVILLVSAGIIIIMLIFALIIADPFNWNLFRGHRTVSGGGGGGGGGIMPDGNGAFVEETVTEIITEKPTEIQTETETETVAESTYVPAGGQFVLPNSDRVYLTEADLNPLTPIQLRIARNEIYARHGRLFDDEWLQSYFNTCTWYRGTIKPDDFDESIFNDYEKKNKDFIRKYENERGYNK